MGAELRLPRTSVVLGFFELEKWSAAMEPDSRWGGDEAAVPVALYDQFALIEVAGSSPTGGVSTPGNEAAVDSTPRAVFYHSTVPDVPLDGELAPSPVVIPPPCRQHGLILTTFLQATCLFSPFRTLTPRSASSSPMSSSLKDRVSGSPFVAALTRLFDFAFLWETPVHQGGSLTSVACVCLV